MALTLLAPKSSIPTTTQPSTSPPPFPPTNQSKCVQPQCSRAILSRGSTWPGRRCAPKRENTARRGRDDLTREKCDARLHVFGPRFFHARLSLSLSISLNLLQYIDARANWSSPARSRFFLFSVRGKLLAGRGNSLRARLSAGKKAWEKKGVRENAAARRSRVTGAVAGIAEPRVLPGDASRAQAAFVTGKVPVKGLSDRCPLASVGAVLCFRLQVIFLNHSFVCSFVIGLL